jgi:hypothetical protein
MVPNWMGRETLWGYKTAIIFDEYEGVNVDPDFIYQF